MNVSDLGETNLINMIQQIITDCGAQGTLPDVIAGIGDDASILHPSPNDLLVTTDQAIENVHFLIDRIPPFNLGWRTIATNISDIAAMAGTPKYVVIALSCPPTTLTDWIKDLYRGIATMCHEAGIAIVGGDVSTSKQHAIAVTMLGETIRPKSQQPQTLQRSKGQPGDKIMVTGTLGGAAGGRSLLFDRGDVWIQTDPTSDLIGLFLHPPNRVNVAHDLIRCGVQAAMDISDGMLIDIQRLAEASNLSARVFSSQVPLNPNLKQHFPSSAIDLALTGGEDYELLFTAPIDLIPTIQDTIDCPVTVVGELITNTKDRMVLIDQNDQEHEISRTGWTHF